jgi:branched-chain amino acid transport system permease protein
MVGGIVLGVSEIFTKAFISTKLSDGIAYIILIIILIFKPSGLLGKKVNEKV